MTKSARGRKARRTEWEAAPGPWSDSEAEMLAATSYVPKKSSLQSALSYSAFAVFMAAAAAALVCDLLLEGRISLVGILAALLAALAASSSLHIALGWEKVVVLRLGKLNRVVGPGFYATIPILEHGPFGVDQRIIATPFRAERTLTADLVPVNIDAVLFWVVWDAEKACVEVEDYYAAISYLAQTSLREAVGRSTVGEVALRRDQLDEEIKADIEKEASGWGVDIISRKGPRHRDPGGVAKRHVLGGSGRPRTQCSHDGGECRSRFGGDAF